MELDVFEHESYVTKDVSVGFFFLHVKEIKMTKIEETYLKTELLMPLAGAGLTLSSLRGGLAILSCIRVAQAWPIFPA